MAPQLAFIGLGNMGQVRPYTMFENAARSLLIAASTLGYVKESGPKRQYLKNELILYNRTISRANELSSRIGYSVVAESLDEAISKADIVFSCLVDEKVVDETFESILKGHIAGKLFVECSTTQREHTNQLARRVEAAGANYVAMPGMMIR